MCDIAAATALFSSYYPNTLYTDAEHFEKKTYKHGNYSKTCTPFSA